MGPNDSSVDLMVKALEGDRAALSRYAAVAPPGEVLHTMMYQIYGFYEAAKPGGALAAAVQPFLAAAGTARRRAGPQQREIDLALMRIVRRSGCLCAVLGAGVTMDAGGPSWPNLVRRLLEIGLDPGFQEVRSVAPDRLRLSHLIAGNADQVVGLQRFTGAQQMEARGIVTAIQQRRANTDMLLRGAELCLKVAGQRLFAEVTDILYENDRAPGAIHEALAELAEPQELLGPGKRKAFGWSGLITYNFDDLMGEALDRRSLPRAAWAMQGAERRATPNAIAGRQGQDKPYLPVIHLHGYSPRRYFYITGVKFVFATSQYDTVYGADQRPMLDSVREQFLANPKQCAIYVGCSFTDAQMNNLLRAARQGLPGREHWAFLEWPGPGRYPHATGDEIERHSAPYLAFGVRPVWFDDFKEIPGLLRALK